MYWVELGTGCRNNKTFCIVRKMCFRKFIAKTIPPKRYSSGGLRVTCKKGACTQPPRIGRVGSHSSLSERSPAGMRENDLFQKLCGTAAGLSRAPLALPLLPALFVRNYNRSRFKENMVKREHFVKKRNQMLLKRRQSERKPS